jgi:hypothetical protein
VELEIWRFDVRLINTRESEVRGFEGLSGSLRVWGKFTFGKYEGIDVLRD